MKAISVRQPWAEAIVACGKRTENRAWRFAPSYRGPILLHAAQSCSPGEYAEAAHWMAARGLAATWLRGTRLGHDGVPGLRALAELPRGGFVARANLVEVVQHAPRLDGHAWPDGSKTCRNCGAVDARRDAPCPKPDPWALPEQLGFILADVDPLPAFIPARGALGLFNVDAAAFEAELARLSRPSLWALVVAALPKLPARLGAWDVATEGVGYVVAQFTAAPGAPEDTTAWALGDAERLLPQFLSEGHRVVVHARERRVGISAPASEIAEQTRALATQRAARELAEDERRAPAPNLKRANARW